MKTTQNVNRRKARAILLIGTLAAVALFAPTGADASRDTATVHRGPKPTVVLVHGAWADGSSWAKVTERLQAGGYDVRVPPNNLRSVAGDAADLAGYLSTISGPIVLVGHSYGGVVITNAATGNAQVKALVYVDAVIPDEGESLGSLTHPPSVFAQDPANFLDFAPYTGAPAGAADTYVKTSVFRDAFANEGFTRREAAVLAATQRPLSTVVFGDPSGPPAWASIPSWAVVGKKDRIIPLADQTAMAKRAGAKVVRVDAPHLSMLTDPDVVTGVITVAAASR